MVKCILFDFWGTIVENGVYPSPVRQVQRILWIKLPFSSYVVQFEEAMMKSKFESLPEAFNTTAEVFKIKLKDYQMDQLVGLWNKNRLLAKPFKETIEVLDELKEAGYKMVLISNSDNFSMEPVLEKFDLNKYFDAKIFSYEVGMLKTEPEMFDLALEKVGVSKEDAIMVGDSMETDIIGAGKAGIRAVLIDRHDKRDHENKIVDLRQLKEIIAEFDKEDEANKEDGAAE